MNPALILIVEDDAILAARLEDMLLQMGYRGTTSTGDEAVKAAQEQCPDAVLMDIRLREAKTGIQAAAQVYQQADIPIIYLTAYTDEAPIEQADQADVFAYLAKPVREHELRASLEMALHKHRLEKHITHLNKVLRTARDIHKLILREHNSQRLLQETCAILQRTRGYPLVWIGQAQDGRCMPLASAGQGKAFLDQMLNGATPQQAQNLPGAAALFSGEADICADIASDERYAPWREVIKKEGFCTSATIPLLYEGENRGIVSIYSQDSTIFDEEEVGLLLEIAGDIAFGLKTIEDENALRKSRDEARRWEESSSKIFQLSPDGISITRLSDGVIMDINDAYAALIGYGRAEAVGKTGRDLDLWLDYGVRDRIMQTVREKGEVNNSEAGFRARGGKTMTCLISGRLMDLAGEPCALWITRDISDRKQMEETLRRSEEKFSGFFHVSPDAISITRLEDGLYLDINEGYTALSGYSRAELIGKTVQDIQIWENAQDRSRMVKELRERGEVSNFEAGFRMKDGQILTCLLSVRPIEFEGQVCLLSVARDISERKRMEEDLRESQERFQLVAETAGEWIWEVDSDGLYTYASPVVETILGYRPEELVGKKHFYDLFTPAVREPLKAAALAAFTRGERIDHFINDNVCKDGRIVILETNGKPTFDENGRLIGYSGADNDVTVRKLAEEALQNNEARLKAIFDAAGILLAMIDPDWHFLQVNQAFISRLGYAQEELGHLGYLDMLHPEEVGRVLKELGKLQKGKKSASRLELRFVAQNGDALWMDLSITPVYGTNGQINSLVAAGFDISERKKAAEEVGFLASLVEQAHNGVIAIDFSNKIIFWNKFAEELYQWTAAEAVGKDIVDLLSPAEMKPTVYRNFEKLNREGHWEGEFNVRRKDGSTIPAHIINTYLKDSDGKNIGFIGISEDISERTKAEKALRESEEALRKSQAAAHLGHWTWDTRSNRVAWSDEMYRIFGYEPGRAPSDLAQVIAQAIHPDDREKVDRSNQTVINEQKPAPMEYRVVWPDGSVHTVWAVPSEAVKDEKGSILHLSGIVQDISGRKQIEEALRRSQAHLDAVFSNSQVFIGASDTEGRFLQVNQAYADLLGYTVEEMLHLSNLDLTHPEDVGISIKDMQDLVAGRISTYRLEKRYLHKNGSSVWVDLSVVPLRDESGKITSLAGAGFDISARKRLEFSLIENEKRFHGMMDNMKEGILLLGYDWRYLYINQAAEVQGGRLAGELLGRTVMECWPGIEDTDFFKLEQKVMQERIPAQIEDSFTLMDGSEHWFDWSIQPADEGLLIITVDITARIENQKKINFQSALLDAVGQAVIATDLDGRVTYINRAAEELYGWPEVDALGRNIAELTVPDYSQDQAAEIMQLLIQGRTWTGEFPVRRRDGNIFPAMVSDAPVLDKKGNVAGVIGVSIDISARRQAEKALAESEARYRDLYDRVPIGLYRSSPEGRILNCNRALLDMVGLPHSEDPTQHLTTDFWVHPDERSPMPEMIQQQGLLDFELEIRRVDGTTFWAHNIVRVERDAGGKMLYFDSSLQDITARRQAEEALHASEAHFRSILEDSDAGYFFIDREGIIRDVNPAWVKLYGYKSADEILGHHFAEIQRLDDLEAARELVAGILRGEKEYMNGEFSRKSTGGTSAYHTFSARPVIRQGEALGIEGFIIDTTERKKIEEELRRTRNFYNAIIENSPVAIFVQSRDDRYMLVNRTWEMERRIPRQKALGARIGDLFPLEVARIFEEENRRVLETQSPQDFETNMGGFGLLHSYQTIKFPILNALGEIESIGGFSLDISERKKAEVALQENEKKYRTLINAMTEGVALHQVQYDDAHNAVDYVIEEVNPAYERQTGIRLEEARGALASTLYGESTAPYLEIYARVAESGQPYSFQTYFPALQRHFEISVVSPRHGWFATIFYDITGRKNIEDSLRRYQLLAENSSDIILFVRQQDGCILDANQAACEAYGYSLADLLAMHISDLTAPGELTGRVTQVELGYSKGIHFETHHRRKSGVIFPVEVSSRGASMDGQAVLLSIIRDISERKQIEQALLAGKQRFESLFQGSPVALLEVDLSRAKYAVEQLLVSGIADPALYFETHRDMLNTISRDLIVLDINRAGLEFFDAGDKTEFLSRLADYSSAFSIPIIISELLALLSGEITSFEKEFQIALSNQEERWIKIDMAVDPEYAHSLERVLVALSDLTGRKHAENVLRQAEERFRTLFETMSQGVFYFDREGHIIQANPAALEIFGLSREEILGRSFDDPRWQRIHEDGSPLLLPGNLPSRKGFRSGKSTLHQVYGNYNPLVKDYRWLDMSVVPLFHQGEDLPYQTYVIFEDITERRRVEKDREELLAKTRRQAERLEAIIHISASLRQAREEKDVLQTLVKESSQGLKSDTILLGLIENQELQFSLAEGEWASFVGQKQEVDESLTRLLFSGKPVSYHSPREIQRARLPLALKPVLKGMQSCLVIPFKVVDAPIGLLLAGYRQPLYVSEDRLSLAAAIGEVAGITLQRMRLLVSLEKLANERTMDLSGLYSVISAAGGSWDIKTVLMRVLEQTLQIVSATDGAVWSVDQVRQQLNLLSVIGLESSRHMIETLSLKETVEGWVVEHSEPLLIPNINLDERFNVPLELQQEDYAYLGLPMRTRGQVMGVLVLLRTGKPFNLEEITLISSIADHIALIIDNLSLYHFYEQAAISEERSRLARDLHDSATQSLFSVTLYAEASRTTAQKGDLAQTEQYLERLSQTAHLALQEMRLLVYELRPPLLEQDGLAVTLRKRLESVEGRAGIQAQTQIDNLVYLDPLQEEHLFWIAMESLNNSLRHAAATQVEVTLKKEENQVVFIVRDNGRGYNLENARQSGGMGLQNMLQRAQKIGARLDINTAPGSGTTVTVFLPLSQANPDR